MKIDCVLTACNLNDLYLDFIPIFIKSWKKILPNADCKIVLISDELPFFLNNYKENIILFTPIKNVSTAFTSQIIRIFYPCILNYNNAVIITDIDMLPMNQEYYLENIKNIDNNKFVYLRDVMMEEPHLQLAICYVLATPKIWSSIFEIENNKDIIEKISKIFEGMIYDERHGGRGWCDDQKVLYNHVMKWNEKTNNFIYLKDRNTKFNRLDRGYFYLGGKFNQNILNKIINGEYSDYHALRPFKKFEKINNFIYKNIKQY